STAVDELANDVSNRGLVRILLPTETEQALQTRLDRVRETVVTMRQIITAVRELYQAVNRMPFVSLPGPSAEDIETVQSGIARLEEDITTLRTEIQAIRDGKSDRIRTVLVITDRIDTELTSTRQRLADTNTKLVNLRAQTAVWLQQLNLILTILSVLISVVLLWIAFSLVTLIRSYWSLLRSPPQLTA
ncbi:MAG: hypothetical protein KDD89_01465, partial [Anaerolineales bacterium]|nr:hypothetical protein [Anaerolineales bacterium]